MQIECKADCVSDLDAHDGMCGWNVRVMDDFQKFVEQRVSTAMFDKLKNTHLLKEREEGQENIESIIRDCVGSAFEEYKNPVEGQLERMTELHEEPEPILEPQDVEPQEESKFHLSSTIGYEVDAATSLSTSPITLFDSELSPSDSTVSTLTSRSTEGSTSLDWLSLDEASLVLDSADDKNMMELFGSMGGDCLQEPRVLPPITSFQPRHCQLWTVGPEFCDHDPFYESLEAVDGGSTNYGFENI